MLGEWETTIQPYYYKGDCGSKPYALDLMLHLHILQNLYNSLDKATAAEVISANIHDVTISAQLQTGEEVAVYGNSGYLGAEKCEDAVTRNKQDKRIRYKINCRSSQSKP